MHARQDARELADPRSISTLTGLAFSFVAARWERARQAGEQNRAGRPVSARGSGRPQPGAAQLGSSIVTLRNGTLSSTFTPRLCTRPVAGQRPSWPPGRLARLALPGRN